MPTKMFQTAVVLNGPPNSGKDTIAFLLEQYGYVKLAFKDRLYKDTAEMFGVSLNEFIQRATDRKLKEEPWDKLRLSVTGFGLAARSISPRKAMIYTSETVMKPKYGKDYFGRCALVACQARAADFVVFSDGGFKEEIQPLERIYKDVLIFRLHRDGCSFKEDSRSYVLGFKNTYDLNLVDGKPELAVADIIDVTNTHINMGASNRKVITAH